jgi:hypothetical protein
MGDVRIAEQHLDSLGPIVVRARQNLDPLCNLGQPGVRIDRFGLVAPGNPVEAGGNIEKFTADFEINAVEHGIR